MYTGLVQLGTGYNSEVRIQITWQSVCNRILVRTNRRKCIFRRTTRARLRTRISRASCYRMITSASVIRQYLFDNSSLNPHQC